MGCIPSRQLDPRFHSKTLHEASSGIAAATSSIIPELADLCATCRDIDLDEAIRRDIHRDASSEYFPGLGSFVKDLGATVQELESSSCSLCRLFASVSPPDSETFGDAPMSTCQLHAYSARGEFMGLTAARLPGDTNLLGIVRTFNTKNFSENFQMKCRIRDSQRERGYLCVTQNDSAEPFFGVRILNSDSFDLGFVNECIDYCRMNHGLACRPQQSSNSFRVIDCETRKVVRAPPNCQYVALSYVWGPPEQNMDDKSDVEASTLHYDTTPNVINDSIEVASKLKLRYLWVDRYCINQSDQDDKHNQIKQMDSIYSNAQITIIAIAGEGPEYGLPGVGGKTRNRQPSLQIGSWIITSTLAFQKEYVSKSKWATRGWTYQEGLLSRHRLIFGEQQVYFECNGMNCAESWTKPLDLMKTKEIAFKSSVRRTPGAEPWEIFPCIAEFSKRQLTYPEDTLAALQGIFNIFEKSPRPVHHIMGVPIILSPTRGIEQCFLIGLSWLSLKPGKRKLQFPSWSWAGWDAPLAFCSGFGADWDTDIDQCHVLVEDDNHQLTAFPEFNMLLDFITEVGPRVKFLHINAPIISSDISLEPEIGGNESFSGSWMRLEIKQNTFSYMQFYPDQSIEELEMSNSGASKSSLTGILLGDLSGETLNIFILVVKEMDGLYQRVGYCGLDFAKFKEGTSPLTNLRYSAYGESFDLLSTWVRSMPYVKRTIRLG